MESWLSFARGPLFVACFTFMILGLLRHAGVTVFEIWRALQRAGDKVVPWRAVATATLKWLLPAGRLKDRWVYSVTTVAFHVSIIVVPVFLGAHIALWKKSVGLSWAAIPNYVADALTLIAVATALAVVAQRAMARDSRALGRFQDYALPLAIAVPFASGFLAAHPAANPFSYDATMLVHALSANMVLLLIPTTKLTHCVLLPATQLISEVAWHFTPDAGSKVALALGKENEPV